MACWQALLRFCRTSQAVILCPYLCVLDVRLRYKPHQRAFVNVSSVFVAVQVSIACRLTFLFAVKWWKLLISKTLKSPLKLVNN